MMANIMCLLSTMFGQLLARGIEGSLLGLKLHEVGQDFLIEYLSPNEVEYLTELKEFQQQDTAIEIGLIGEKAKHRSVYQPPRVLYEIGDSEEELPGCSDRNEVCNKVDLYGSPWVERQCRCPNSRTCPSSLDGDDGHTILDKTRQYKLCLPICRYFKDVTWTLAPGAGPPNATLTLTPTIQRVYGRCRPGSVPLPSSKTTSRIFRRKSKIYLRFRVFSAKQATLSAQGTLSTVHRTKETQLAARRGERVTSLPVS